VFQANATPAVRNEHAHLLERSDREAAGWLQPGSSCLRQAHEGSTPWGATRRRMNEMDAVVIRGRGSRGEPEDTRIPHRPSSGRDTRCRTATPEDRARRGLPHRWCRDRRAAGLDEWRRGKCKMGLTPSRNAIDAARLEERPKQSVHDHHHHQRGAQPECLSVHGHASVEGREANRTGIGGTSMHSRAGRLGGIG
jgi:hypothetical protein